MYKIDILLCHTELLFCFSGLCGLVFESQPHFCHLVIFSKTLYELKLTLKLCFFTPKHQMNNLLFCLDQNIQNLPKSIYIGVQSHWSWIASNHCNPKTYSSLWTGIACIYLVVYGLEHVITLSVIHHLFVNFWHFRFLLQNLNSICNKILQETTMVKDKTQSWKYRIIPPRLAPSPRRAWGVGQKLKNEMQLWKYSCRKL